MELVEYNKESRSLMRPAEEYRRRQAQMVDYMSLMGGLMAAYFMVSGDLLGGSMVLVASCGLLSWFKGEVGILESWKA